MKPRPDYSLYLVTDRGLMRAETVEQSVEQAVRGGCTLVQLREKELPSLDFFNAAVRVKRITDHHGVPLIINDRADIALAVDAAGVHVGQGDLPVEAVRALMGSEKIVGVSVSSLAEAELAERGGADYLGVGALFATGTKSDASLTSVEDLRSIKKASGVPVVAIGGINSKTVPLLAGTGIDGIAVVSAVVAAEDAASAASELRELLRRI